MIRMDGEKESEKSVLSAQLYNDDDMIKGGKIHSQIINVIYSTARLDQKTIVKCSKGHIGDTSD